VAVSLRYMSRFSFIEEAQAGSSAYHDSRGGGSVNSPQIESGYTRIANELLDAIIAYPFSRREFAIVFALIRVTYGYQKKEDAISGWQLSEMTGIDRSHVSKTITELIEKKVVNRSDSGRISHGQNVPFLSINKHYKQWATVAEKATVKTVAKSATQTVADSATVAKTAPLPNWPHTVAETATVTVADLAQRPLPKQPTHKEIPKEIKEIPKEIKTLTEKPSLSGPVQEACRATWDAYKKAYEKRYGIPPIRNARISSIIKQFVGRIGYDESPHVAAFFVSHDDAFYCRKAHAAGVMLADAEKLRTEWATGKQFTQPQFKTAGQLRNENTDKAVAEFLGESSEDQNFIEGEFRHA
jgi:phage replication O-like protein O